MCKPARDISAVCLHAVDSGKDYLCNVISVSYSLSLSFCMYIFICKHVWRASDPVGGTFVGSGIGRAGRGEINLCEHIRNRSTAHVYRCMYTISIHVYACTNTYIVACGYIYTYMYISLAYIHIQRYLHKE